jgi:hypothetical protein
MRYRLIVAMVALVGITPATGQNWQDGQHVFTRAAGVTPTIGFFLNTHTAQAIPAQCGKPSQWCTVDLTAVGIPATAQSAFLSGILIITPGSKAGVCDLHITVRAPNENIPSGDYQMQTAIVAPKDTARSNAAVWVPLVNGQFQLYWWATPQKQMWPTYCSFGANLQVQSYTMGPTLTPSAQAAGR